MGRGLPVSDPCYTAGLVEWVGRTRMEIGQGLMSVVWMLGPNWPYGGEIDIIEGMCY